MRIAYLRRPDGLYGLFIERVEPFKAPKVGDGLQGVGTYVERIAPLELSKLGVHDHDLERALSGIRAGVFGPQLIKDVEKVVRRTVADRGHFPKGLAWPQLKPAPKDPMRTARHTRGYKGTKAQLPKQASHKPFDILPYLDGGAHETGVLDTLSEFGQFEAEGNWTPENRAAAAQMPEDFHLYFMWTAEENSWEHTATRISLYWNLGLADNEPLKLLVVLMTFYLTLTGNLRWAEAMASLSARRRVAFAELVLELDVRGDCKGDLTALLARLDELCTDGNFRYRAHHLLTEWKNEATAWEVLAQFELLNDYWPEGNLIQVDPVVGAASIVRAAMESLQGSDDSWARTGYCAPLLGACGDFEGFADRLAAAPLAAMGPEVAFEYLRLFTSLLYSDHDWDITLQRWGWLKGRAADWGRAILTVDPEFRMKYVGYLMELVDEWDGPEELQANMPPLESWVDRICKAPFVGDAIGSYALCRLAHLPADLGLDLMRVPDGAFLNLEKATRRDNDDSLVAFGLSALVRIAPGLVADGLNAGTGSLATAARSLGSLHKGDGVRFVGELHETELFQADPDQEPIEKLVGLIQTHGSASAQNLISRKLRQHLDGTLQLTAQQVERVASKIRKSWPDVLLGTLADGVPRLLAGRLGAGAPKLTTQESHALRMVFAAQGNRRMLRKILKQHFAGDRDYIQNHPINQAWLDKHPGLRDSGWCRGFEITSESQKYGWVTIALEFDPLEVLRVGTYVGTCFGLGGGFAHSAAAIMMDGNKHVAYCRDGRGVILARQVLAVLEDDRLCCFEIFPEEGSNELAACFAEFDRGLAKDLGASIFDPDADDEDDAGDNVLHLLSSDWWNDYPMQVPID